MRRVRSHLTYANVMATLAVFVVLGGSAYAAFHLPRNSVRSKNIVNGQVKTPDLANDAVTSKSIGNGQVKERDLAKPPNPIAFAEVSSGGGIRSSTGMPNAKVEVPTTGVFCLSKLGFTWKGAQVTTDADNAVGLIAPQVGRSTGGCTHEEAVVTTVGSDDTLQPAGFFIAFYK